MNKYKILLSVLALMMFVASAPSYADEADIQIDVWSDDMEEMQDYATPEDEDMMDSEDGDEEGYEYNEEYDIE
jgi:hypothetical protein